MVRYYNPHNYTVSFTTADGGRIALRPVVPGEVIASIEGDYYSHLVKRGTLALLTSGVQKENAAAYKQLLNPKRKTWLPSPRGRAPQQADKPMGSSQVTPPPTGMTDAEFKKAAEEPLKKDPEPVVEAEVVEFDEGPLFSRASLNELSMKDLYAVIKANEDFEKPKKGAKKKDLIDLILANQ